MSFLTKISSFNITNYIPSSALDATLAGYIINDDKFSKNAGAYTESIHTNAGVDGYLTENADVDFYPNGGISMPGCASGACDHAR